MEANIGAGEVLAALFVESGMSSENEDSDFGAEGIFCYNAGGGGGFLNFLPRVEVRIETKTPLRTKRTVDSLSQQSLGTRQKVSTSLMDVYLEF